MHKPTITFFLLMIITMNMGYCQVDLLNNTKEACRCFESYNKEKKIKKCIKTKKQKNDNFIDSSLTSPTLEKKFVETLIKKCPAATSFFKKHLYQKEDYPDSTYTKKFYKILSYFKNMEEEKSELKKVHIVDSQYGLIYNIYLNKMKNDTILSPGENLISRHDSVIKMKTTVKKMDFYYSCTTNSSEYRLNVSLKYKLKKESLNELYEYNKKNYEERILKPELKYAIRENCGKIIPDQEINSTKRENSEVLLKALRNQLESYNYFTFYEVIISI